MITSFCISSSHCLSISVIERLSNVGYCYHYHREVQSARKGSNSDMIIVLLSTKQTAFMGINLSVNGV